MQKLVNKLSQEIEREEDELQLVNDPLTGWSFKPEDVTVECNGLCNVYQVYPSDTFLEL